MEAVTECTPSYDKSKEYWDHQQATVDGMLGGFSRISKVDAASSNRFLSAFFDSPERTVKRQKSRSTSPEDEEINFAVVNTKQGKRALDCGAGIGRVTKLVLLNYFDKVDLLEQNQAFLDKAREYIGEETYDKRIDNAFCAGLQNFEPLPDVKYDCIWCQWVSSRFIWFGPS